MCSRLILMRQGQTDIQQRNARSHQRCLKQQRPISSQFRLPVKMPRLLSREGSSRMDCQSAFLFSHAPQALTRLRDTYYKFNKYISLRASRPWQTELQVTLDPHLFIVFHRRRADAKDLY